jgi:hypothetical protein
MGAEVYHFSLDILYSFFFIILYEGETASQDGIGNDSKRPNVRLAVI